jgi:D-mannose binding lectin.
MAANSILPNNTKLTGYTYVSFGSVQQTLSMQTDGNLVYRDGSTVKWQSNTHVKGSSARLTTKAQLQVVAPNGSTLWSSSPTGTTYSVLDIGLASIWQYRPTTNSSGVSACPEGRLRPPEGQSSSLQLAGPEDDRNSVAGRCAAPIFGSTSATIVHG